MTEKLVVPLDSTALNLILEAMETCYSVDEEGNHTRVGGTITLNDLLMFWSGYDESLQQEISDNMTYYPHPILSYQDVIRALIKEVQHLRERSEEEQ